MNLTKVKSAGQVYPDFLSLYTIDSDDEYIPEIILDERLKGSTVQYLVKFKDYSFKENQWLYKKKLTNYPDVLETWNFEKSLKPRKLTRLQKLDEKEDKNILSPKTQLTSDDTSQEEKVRHRLRKNTEELSFDNIETVVKKNQIDQEKGARKQTTLFASKENLYPEYSKIYKFLLKQIEESRSFAELIKKKNLLSLQ